MYPREAHPYRQMRPEYLCSWFTSSLCWVPGRPQRSPYALRYGNVSFQNLQCCTTQSIRLAADVVLLMATTLERDNATSQIHQAGQPQRFMVFFVVWMQLSVITVSI